jgi:hypothetical protein
MAVILRRERAKRASLEGCGPVGAGRGCHPPTSGLPEVGFKMRKSALADLRWLGAQEARRAPKDDGSKLFRALAQSVSSATPGITSCSTANDGGKSPSSRNASTSLPSFALEILPVSS